MDNHKVECHHLNLKLDMPEVKSFSHRMMGMFNSLNSHLPLLQFLDKAKVFKDRYMGLDLLISFRRQWLVNV